MSNAVPQVGVVQLKEQLGDFGVIFLEKETSTATFSYQQHRVDDGEIVLYIQRGINCLKQH